MTYEDFSKLPFKFYCHLNFGDDGGATTYRCTDPRYPKVWICVHTTHGERTRTYKHWKINGKVCKTKKTLIEAIKEL